MLEAQGLGSHRKEKDFMLKTLRSHSSDSGRGWHSLICIFKFCSDNKSLGLVLTLLLTHCVILGQVPFCINKPSLSFLKNLLGSQKGDMS